MVGISCTSTLIKGHLQEYKNTIDTKIQQTESNAVKWTWNNILYIFVQEHATIKLWLCYEIRRHAEKGFSSLSVNQSTSWLNYLNFSRPLPHTKIILPQYHHFLNRADEKYCVVL